MTREDFYRAIPWRLREALGRYFVHRYPPGSFMTALLSNDLRQTFACADEDSRECLHELVAWVYNFAPAGSWGSLERVAIYLADDTLYTHSLLEGLCVLGLQGEAEAYQRAWRRAEARRPQEGPAIE